MNSNLVSIMLGFLQPTILGTYANIYTSSKCLKFPKKLIVAFGR